ncbi:MAG TPA: glycosyltransferase family 2 protein [Bacteroidales bacterium]|nr:MAG: glycosyl transferase [Bacteroidetes bacterium GWE2_42_24]OFY25541.1 MAG: glycosyl transferase [Bacteroidetes bacterium GWF2_43_11]PKP20326.1 MAG: glycosyltransferase family 2 protein [Bacteroidetes bacterium HGW-Bacteroidetes-22]HAQ66100.1 glycosyltransferase family 2 protein [Bacteroidales bacterium]HBZ66352.1 glycosyltransferase family 2 protein [Bacteroidales bacterium]
MKSDNPEPLKLSAVIITLNEEANIQRCIQSLLIVADEVVVVDSGSTDLTQDLATSMGAKVIFHPFEGHIQQKNFALSVASFPLILSLDADEALSPELATSICEVKHSPAAMCYSMNRMTNYCGKWIRHGGWYPDIKVRLIRSGKACWDGVNPHDKLTPEPNADIRHLKGDLLHYSINSLADHLKQIDYFTTIAARERVKQSKPVGIHHLLLNPAAKFIKDYFLRGGFRDGLTGFAIASFSAWASFLKYMKTAFLYRGL